MQNTWLQKVIFIAIAVVFLLAPEGRAASRDPLLEKAATLKRNLEVKGYQVLGNISYSQFGKVDPGTLYCNGQVDSCNGFNFGGGYDAPMVPALPGQADTPPPPLFRLRYNEAVVLVAETPPPMRFFQLCLLSFLPLSGGMGTVQFAQDLLVLRRPLEP